MRLGVITSLPNEYSQFAQIKDRYGTSYSVDLGEVPKSTDEGDEYAYKLELWGGNSGIAYDLIEED